MHASGIIDTIGIGLIFLGLALPADVLWAEGLGEKEWEGLGGMGGRRMGDRYLRGQAPAPT